MVVLAVKAIDSEEGTNIVQDSFLKLNVSSPHVSMFHPTYSFLGSVIRDQVEHQANLFRGEAL
jgi:hypothetical protein